MQYHLYEVLKWAGLTDDINILVSSLGTFLRTGKRNPLGDRKFYLVLGSVPVYTYASITQVLEIGVFD